MYYTAPSVLHRSLRCDSSALWLCKTIRAQSKHRHADINKTEHFHSGSRSFSRRRKIACRRFKMGGGEKNKSPSSFFFFSRIASFCLWPTDDIKYPPAGFLLRLNSPVIASFSFSPPLRESLRLPWLLLRGDHNFERNSIIADMRTRYFFFFCWGIFIPRH